MEFEFVFSGEESERGVIDFYDAARALAGFQRSLAIVTHLAINGEVITHAPKLSGAQILFPAIEHGSWKAKALVILGSMVTLGSVGKDSPVGHVVTSLYDYVLSETMGFHPDYSRTLQDQYAQYLHEHKISRDKIDSAIEKCENSVADMHRPIVVSGTAGFGRVFAGGETDKKIGPDFNEITYDYVRTTIRDPNISEITGSISSFNNNTYKGRVFSPEDGRPIPFELLETARDRRSVGRITRSQHLAGQRNFDESLITLVGYRLSSTTGRLKRLHVIEVR